MKVQDFKILADENLHKVIVAWLRAQGFDVRFVREFPEKSIFRHFKASLTKTSILYPNLS